MSRYTSRTAAWSCLEEAAACSAAAHAPGISDAHKTKHTGLDAAVSLASCMAPGKPRCQKLLLLELSHKPLWPEHQSSNPALPLGEGNPGHTVQSPTLTAPNVAITLSWLWALRKGDLGSKWAARGRTFFSCPLGAQ